MGKIAYNKISYSLSFESDDTNPNPEIKSLSHANSNRIEKAKLVEYGLLSSIDQSSSRTSAPGLGNSIDDHLKGTSVQVGVQVLHC